VKSSINVRAIVLLGILTGWVFVACSGTESVQQTPASAPPSSDEAPLADDVSATVSTVSQESIDVYQSLLHTEIPAFDPVAVAIMLDGVDPSSIPEPPSEPVNIYTVGDTETFWVLNYTLAEVSQTEATLAHISEHAYYWVDNRSQAVNAHGTPMTEDDWEEVGAAFDAAYEAVREMFGEENLPGIDGDPRLHILHSDTSHVGQIYGYFSELDTRPAAIQSGSNQHEMFVAAIDRMGGIGGPAYISTLAHEYQHAIQYNLDPNEDVWLNEGFSKLAEMVATGSHDPRTSTFTDNPDQSLWYWGDGGVGDYFHALFVLDYLAERYGQGFIREVASNPANGLESIDRTLASMGYDETFDEVFGDFMVAYFLNDPSIEDGRYAIENLRYGRAGVAETLRGIPADYQDTVNQYGLDAIRITGDGPSTLTFDGAESVALVPAEARSGDWMWWSNRADLTFGTLTHEFDLSGVDSATLTFWAWYAIEESYDYIYLMASTDGGQTWETVETSISTQDNPVGNNHGNGITGASGDWVPVTADLSPYAGQTIQLGFTMMNDSGLNEAGMLIDDIEIAEIGFADDVEGGEDGWAADGFVRVVHTLPQRWLVRVALVGDTTSIETLEIVNGVGTLDVDFGSVDEIIVFVTGQTRFTAESAPYEIRILPQ
jgi:immune inhibitor A